MYILEKNKMLPIVKENNIINGEQNFTTTNLLGPEVISDNTIIFIAGITCSGKTTYANEIAKTYGNNTMIINQDNWFKDLKDVPKESGRYNMEIPTAYHIDEMICDIEELLDKGFVKIPTYAMKYNARTNKDTIVKKKPIIIIEGLHSLYLIKSINLKKIEKYKIIALYLDTNKDICLKRRVVRDTTVLDVHPQQVVDKFENVIFPAYVKCAQEQIIILDTVKSGYLLKE